MEKKHDPEQLPHVQKLHAVVGKLTNSNYTFAQSLIAYYRQFKKLSPKQMEWVRKLTTEAEGPTAASSKPPLFELPGMNLIETLLYGARKGVSWPCIRLMYGKVRIELRPKERSKGINVTYDKKKIGAFVDEKFYASSMYEPNYPGLVFSIQELIDDPVGTAARFGKETKCCSFCGIGLTDPRSQLVGYGPICADNYGLPWGDRPAKVVSEKTVEDLEKLL